MVLIPRSRGFTLIEVIIAVALVAIMAVAIAPPLVQNIREGKITRAQSDAQSIGTAVMSFYKDVGQWPVTEGSSTLTRLAGNESLGGGNAGIPRGANGIAGGGGWDSMGNVGTFATHLIKNETAAIDSVWTFSANPMVSPGWNGPYLTQVNLDPWGNPYVINIRYGRAAIAGTGTADFNKHNLMVISAGPNKLFETPMSNGIIDETIGGDDIGFIFNRATRY